MEYTNRSFVLSLTFLIFCLITSCKKDKFQNNSKLIHTDPSITLVGVPSIISILDKDTTITVDFELSNPIAVDLDLTISYKDGFATYGDDFEISTESIHIPAYTKSGSFDIYILGDDALEGKEDFSVTIGSNDDVNFNNPKTLNIELFDFMSDDLDIEFLWNKMVDVPDYGLISTCGNFDLDFYVYNEDGDDTENYDAATENCPEMLVFNRFDNVGTFYITQVLYLNEFDGLGLSDKVPVSCSFRRPGIYAPSIDYIQPDDLAFDLSTLDEYYNNEWTEQDFLKIVISNDGFTVYDLSDNKVSQARKSSFKYYPKNLSKFIKVKNVKPPF